MAGRKYTSLSTPVSDKNFNGGLNSTSGPLNLQNNESSDLQNIDFNKFGSILSRNGTTVLNSASLAGGADCELLTWFEYESTGTQRKAINVSGTSINKMTGWTGLGTMLLAV